MRFRNGISIIIMGYREMEIKYSLVQIGRNVENGRYCGQIQLGDGFLKQVSEMSSSISWLGFQNEKTA